MWVFTHLKTTCLPASCEGLAGLGVLSEEMVQAKLLSFPLPSLPSAWLSHDNPQGDQRKRRGWWLPGKSLARAAWGRLLWCAVFALVLIQLLPKPSLTPGTGDTAMTVTTVQSPKFGEPRARTTTCKGCLLRKDDGVPWSHSASGDGRQERLLGGFSGAGKKWCVRSWGSLGWLLFRETCLWKIPLRVLKERRMLLLQNPLPRCESGQADSTGIASGRMTGLFSNMEEDSMSSSCSASLRSPFLFFPYGCRASPQEIQGLLKAGSAELNFSACVFMESKSLVGWLSTGVKWQALLVFIYQSLWSMGPSGLLFQGTFYLFVFISQLAYKMFQNDIFISLYKNILHCLNLPH